MHKKRALIKEKMLGSGFGCSTRTCRNRVDVKIANVPHKDWDAYAVKVSLHLQEDCPGSARDHLFLTTGVFETFGARDSGLFFILSTPDLEWGGPVTPTGRLCAP